MFYQLYEWQRPGMTSWLGALRVPGLFMPWQRVACASSELVARSLEAVELQELGLEAAVVGDAPGPIFHELLQSRPFWRLLRFRRRAGGGVRILLLTPHSGYASAILSQLIHALLELGEVLVTDWVDARLVPQAAGRFGLDEQAAAVAGLVRRHGPGLHVVAVSQAGPAALAASREIAAAAPERAPASLTLIGAAIDPSRSPPVSQQWLAALPRAAVEQHLLTIVPGRYPGAGRRVYPGLFQLLAFAAASPLTYLDVQTGLLTELLLGAPSCYARQHADLHRLVDVPAELFLDTLNHVAQPLFSADAPEAAGRIRLLTVEAGADGLVGPGQTHAAHALLGARGGTAAGRITIANAQHHDLFLGRRFANEVAPAVVLFIRASAE
jgi:poly(3-hydroxybutyrate) depolymerase